MEYVADKHFIYLKNTPYSRKDEIKQNLSGVWFDTAKRGKGYRFPRNLHAYRELYKFFPELREKEKFMKDYEKQAKIEAHYLQVKNLGSPCDYGLRKYQNDDVSYLLERGSCLVLNEPRTGRLVI